MTSWPIRGQRGGAGRGGRSADPGQAGPPQALRCVGPHGLQQLLSSQLLWPSPMIHPSLRVAPAHGPPARGRKSRWCGGWRRGLQQTRGGGMILPGQREPTPGPGADSQRRSWPQTLVQSPASQVLSCRAVNASIVGGCSPTAPSGTECVCGGGGPGGSHMGRARPGQAAADPGQPPEPLCGWAPRAGGRLPKAGGVSEGLVMGLAWASAEPRSALPGGVDRVAWESGSATGKSLQVEPESGELAQL